MNKKGKRQSLHLCASIEGEGEMKNRNQKVRTRST